MNFINLSKIQNSILATLLFLLVSCGDAKYIDSENNPIQQSANIQYDNKSVINWDLDLIPINIYRSINFNRSGIMELIQFVSTTQEQINDFWYSPVEFLFKMNLQKYTNDDFGRPLVVSNNKNSKIEIHFVNKKNKKLKVLLDQKNLDTAYPDTTNNKHFAIWKFQNHIGKSIYIKVEINANYAFLWLSKDKIEYTSLGIFNINRGLCSLSTNIDWDCGVNF